MDATTQRFVHAAIMLVVAALAWSVGGRARPHLLVASLFGVCLAADVARFALDPVLNAATVPYRGAVLVAYYVDHALVLAFRFALLAACAKHFANIGIRFSLIAYAATVTALIVYKQTTAASLLPFHHVVSAVVVGLGWILVARAVLAPRDRFVTPDAGHAVLVLMLAADLVKALLQYGGPVTQTWASVRNMDLVVHGIVVVGYSVTWIRRQARRWSTSQS